MNKDGNDLDPNGNPVSRVNSLDLDWKEGYLATIKESPWNTAYGVSRTGVPYPNADITKATSEQFVSFLTEAYQGSYPLKALPNVLHRRHINDVVNELNTCTSDPNDYKTVPWSLPAAIDWYENGSWSNTDTVVRNYDAAFASMVGSVTSSQAATAGLGGWMLADEPYAGDASRVYSERTASNTIEVSYNGSAPPNGPDTWFLNIGGTLYDLVTSLGPPYPFQGGIDGSFVTPAYGCLASTNSMRDDLYFRMKYMSLQLQTNWDTSSDHPIHAVLRADGNYGWSSTSDVNKSARISNVIHDDHYLYDYVNGSLTAIWKTATQAAVDNLLSQDDPPQALVQWHDGMAHNNGGTIWIAPEEDIRYTVYSSIVHGARGTMFWFLSKSEQDAFDLATKVALEVNSMKEYLLAQPNFSGEVYLTASTHPSTPPPDADFIIRINPTNSNKALVVIVNDLGSGVPSINVHFPSTWQFNTVESINPIYNWSYAKSDTDSDGKYDQLSIGAGDWHARAFIVTKQ